MFQRRGLMFVLSSPSGAGKTTIARKILERDHNLEFSVSQTTRAMRPGEVNHLDYHFVSQQQFEKGLQEESFLEHAQVFGNYYGTLKEPVLQALEQGRDILFDIDWQGVRQIVAKAVEGLVTVFILPPSLAELEQRLRARRQDSDSIISQRMAHAQAEIAQCMAYDYVVINENLETAVDEVYAILTSERLRSCRRKGLSDTISQFAI